MNAAVLPPSDASRDPFKPPKANRTGRALTLAVLAHLLLIVALTLGVHWHTDEPTTIAAELWSATPQAAAPRAVEPPPTPPTPAPKPTPTPKVEPAPTPTPSPPQPDPQIAIEKAKREQVRKQQQAEEEAQKKADLLAQQKADKAQRDKDAAQKKAEADKQAAKDKADKDKADKAAAAQEAAARDKFLKRMQGMAGATGGATDTGTALRSSAPSSSYAGRILARVKPNIVFDDNVDGNPVATVEVRLAPDGTIVGKRLVKSSGAKSWDEAVLRAIDRTGQLPRDIDGRVPPVIQIDFKPREM